MQPEMTDLLISKFSNEDKTEMAMLLRREERLILRKSDGATVFCPWAPEAEALVRDALSLLGWNETACLRPFDPERDTAR